MTRVTVVGDAFLDLDWTGRVERVSPDDAAPVLDVDAEVTRPGGAGLAALHAAQHGAVVTLVTALGADAEGDRVRAALEDAGVVVIDLGLDGPTPVKVRLRAGGRSLARADRHCSPVAAIGAWRAVADRALDRADAVLVSDYGRGATVQAELVAAVDRLRHRIPVVWDPHQRGAVPPRGLGLLTPNLAEATALAGGQPDGDTGVARTVALAEALAQRFGGPVAVTAGEQGAALAQPGEAPAEVPVAPAVGDVCGAGDRFAATAAVELADGATCRAAVTDAVDAARRHVAGRPRPDPAPGPSAAPLDGVGLAHAVRRRGGTVVAAGGCFDVLHAGHVQLLEAARRLGDCLVVCVNDDRSVRRLKGDGRPANPLADRVAVLEGLACVDAVVPFGEDTPAAVLTRLRPHLFVKGQDHAGAPLPERRVLAEWGGRVVLLPLLAGRSTTRILRAAAS